MSRIETDSLGPVEVPGAPTFCHGAILLVTDILC